MRLGRVEGRIWASVKDVKLKGVQLAIMQPIDEQERPEGNAIIAADSVGTTEGDIVFWVNSTEASFLYEGQQIPSEISIVGLVDRVDIGEEYRPGGEAP